jgi:hypothetical protein
MQMRALVLLASLALVGAAGAQATVGRGSLAGVVKRGPIAPVCVVEQPCDEPAKGVTLLFSRNDRVVGRVITDDQGRYRLQLPAGLYSVRRPAAASIDRKLEPNHVRVYARRAAHVDFSIDTGIR